MSGLVESAIFNALDALATRDMERSRRVIADDDYIDAKERSIEIRCIELIRREAPLASDLRRLVSVLLIANELERVGDYAEGIAKISIMLGSEPLIKRLVDVPRMADLAVNMLKRSIDAYIEQEPETVEASAAHLGKEDDKVDDLYDKVHKDLMDIIRAEPDKVEQCTHLLWVAHNLERVADRATNIAERAVYQTSGKMVSIHSGGTEEVKVDD